jgi:hypothetical protein
MKMYKTFNYGYQIKEFEITQRTPKSVTFIEEYRVFMTNEVKTRVVRELIHTSYGDWHETRNEAENFLLRRIDSNIKHAENKITKLKIERQKLINSSE